MPNIKRKPIEERPVSNRQAFFMNDEDNEGEEEEEGFAICNPPFPAVVSPPKAATLRPF